MRKIIALVLVLLLCAVPVQAMEFIRQKNVATIIGGIPLVDADGDACASAAGIDTEGDSYADGTAPDGFADLTNDWTEIGTSGVGYLSLAQAETNVQYLAIQIKTSSSGCKTQYLVVRFTVGAPANAATTDDGGTINVTGGAIDTVTTATTATNLTNAPTNGDLTATMKTSVTTAATSSTPALSAAGVDAIWDEVVTAHSTASTFGKLFVDNLNATVSSRSTLTAANVWDTDISGYSTAGYAGTYLKGASAPAASAVADAVWDEAISGHLGAGTTGNALNAAGSAGDPWSTPIPGAYGAGTAGYIIGTNINAPIGTVDTVVDAIKAKTDSLTFTGAGIVDANVVNWKGATAPAMTGDAYARLGAPAGASVSADVAAVKSDSAAILTDTAAMDTANELRTLLTGGTSAVSTHSAADVWAVAARTLTAGTNIALAKGTGITGFNDLDAAGIAGAVFNAATASYGTAGTYGLLLETNLDATVSSRGTSTLTAQNVWEYATRVLSAGTNISLAKGTGVTGFNDIAATDVWAAATRTLTALDEDSTTLDLNGTAVGSVTSGVTVTTNNDKTGYALSQAFPTNFSALSIDASGRIDLGKWVGVAPNALSGGKVDSFGSTTVY